ncbi:CapA family protein [Carnobacteriaceae bacterium zg-84]|uniref:CapA family protein n=1 Tax=Granulicatella sp. zg-84 TaxID=2678503 RepID=UPI0013C0F31A|nr:CapA family protein [Granulicatella sp. zg-84]NEW66234.1 metallophosphatase [Granulicatella sp. zg-84]QMI85925.1 CapA family protein [Carnobacteriaceae bacterium zg-84]
MRRSRHRKKSHAGIMIGLLSILVCCLLGFAFLFKDIWLKAPATQTQEQPHIESTTIQKTSSVQTARIMANGDILYHDLLYMSALQENGTYDFKQNFKYVKEWLAKADLAIGDFEGTIAPDKELAGYPTFNAPIETADAIKWAGYHVMDLAHNHILDTGIEGIKSTVKAFDERGIDTFGVFAKRSRNEILVKEVNGIKIAILGYAYGFNGIEQTISQKDYDDYLADLNEEKIKRDLEKAEKIADITIVMPQMGIEYALEPTPEQVALYHKMIDWGADIIFGGHPHVIEPSETVVKNGDKKFIIYSMGNFISNQRIETLDNEWTERGLLMDVTIKKENDKTIIDTVQAHPTWVSRTPNGRKSPNGYDLYDYTTYILQDFIQGGKYRDMLDEATQKRIDKAYKEVNEHVNLKWSE